MPSPLEHERLIMAGSQPRLASLGLATVSEIAGQHHGWVTVTTAVGRGTTFDVYFPSLAA